MNRLELQRWRYHFVDLPLWALGVRSPSLERRLYAVYEQEADHFRKGYENLCRFTGRNVEEQVISDVLRKTFWVKVVRESDAYTSLRMTKGTVGTYFTVEGIDHLKGPAAAGRPVIILTGHIGSFFIPSIAFTAYGIDVYPIARTVDRSSQTPVPVQIYQSLNYRFSEKRFSTRYIYTDFSGRIERDVVTIARKGGIFWVAVDFPKRLYPYKRLPVTFFGQRATLPAGIIQWGLKKGALFTTGWNRIERNGRGFYRHLTVDDPIGATDAVDVLQIYADRLARCVQEEPWQWMALQVIHQYMESETSDA